MSENYNEEQVNTEEVKQQQNTAPKSTLPTTDEDIEVLHELIRGTNDIFTKTYTFKEIGKTFEIKVRYPNFIEKGRINALREDMLVGTGKYQPADIVLIYQTMAILEVCGIDIPKYFDKEQSPREDVLFKIGVDIDNWVYSFR